jgi:hypothetical protein
MAEKATISSGFDKTIREQAAARASLAGYPVEAGPGFFTHVATDYHVALLRCHDIAGDGGEEMIVGLGAGAAGRIFNWAVFTPDANGRWALLFDREGAQVNSIHAGDRAIVVRTPTFKAGAPLCCPSGFKPTRVAFQEGEADVDSSDVAPSQREIVVDEGRVVRLAGLDPLTDSPTQALAEFGSPTSIGGSWDSSCPYEWSDLGLTITFANFGGGDPCGPEGRMGSFELSGAPAAQAGWRTNEGAEVGMDAGTVRSLYPGARESGHELVLIETPSPIGSGGTIDVMTGFLAGGKAWAYRFYVGAAGE